MLDGRGFVAETNATNLFAVIKGRLCTPRSVACPEGITRATVLKLAAEHGVEVDVRDISLAEMYAAKEVFCTGTMGEIVPVTQIDGREVGDGLGGPVTARFAGLYREYARRTGTLVVTPATVLTP
jgi:branched-chain amino acid aminotransferase